jgi:hypothetical protein
MIMLSEVVARAYCPAAAPAGPLRFFSVGCQAAGASWFPADAADAARIAAQARGLGRAHLPWEPDTELDGVFNDLFSPWRDDSDGRLTIWIPVPVEEPLSSTLMPRDWRVVALAWWAARRVGADPARKAVIVAFDSSGRTVAADIRVEDLYSAMEAAIAIQASGREVPGAACAACTRALGCRGLEAFVSELGPQRKPAPDEADDMRNLRLFSELTSVGMRLESLEARRDLILAELGKAVHEGLLKVGPDQSLEVPSRASVAWDFSMVRGTLMSSGFWSDSLGSIRAGELAKSLEKYPDKVKKELAKARTDKVGQPSIMEAMRHASFAARPTTFGIASSGRAARLGAGQ